MSQLLRMRDFNVRRLDRLDYVVFDEIADS